MTDITQVLVGVADAMATAEATEAAKRVESPPIPKKFSRTERVLVHMMRENCGASILDSGGAYGRAWQRALTEDFANRERGSLEVWYRNGKAEFNPTIDLFSYLSEKLEYDRAMTRAFNKFAALPENESEGWPAISEAFPAYISEKRGLDLGEPRATENSYNVDNYLSGTIQVVYFELDGQPYCILQIHGGCDVRGGYTAPKVFTCSDEWSIFDWYRATIVPDWHEVSAIREQLLAGLNEQTWLFPNIEAELRADVEELGREVWWDVGSCEDHGQDCQDLKKYPAIQIEERSQWKRGLVCVLPTHEALCPVTGAMLTASFC
jgi:hypothetical protein